MFDSDNIPLITRIEAAPGILVNFTVNSEGEGVYYVKVDSDYVSNLVDKSMVFNQDTLAAQMVEIRSLLGFTAAAATTPTTPVDTTHKVTVAYSQSATTLTNTLSLKWRLNSFDGGELASRELTFAAGSTRESVIKSLFYTILKNAAAMNYIYYNTTNANDANNIRTETAATTSNLVFSFKPGYENFEFQIINVANAASSDGSSFKVTQQ